MVLITTSFDILFVGVTMNIDNVNRCFDRYFTMMCARGFLVYSKATGSIYFKLRRTIVYIVHYCVVHL